MLILRDGFAWNWLVLKNETWVLAEGRKCGGESGGGEEAEGRSEM